MRKINEFCSCIASAQQLETEPPGKDLRIRVYFTLLVSIQYQSKYRG